MRTLRYGGMIKGIVQGVGFRPFFYHLAREETLTGWVCNSGSSVDFEVEGVAENLDRFFRRLEAEKPGPARVEKIHRELIPIRGDQGFHIHESRSGTGEGSTLVPDLAVCGRCLSEVYDPGNRRYLYPFTTCTLCGPRYTLLENIPFDRKQTSMRDFEMCTACRNEYESPKNRRFHSQTNSCTECGPTLELRDQKGALIERAEFALSSVAQAIREGQIVAVKGVGGFHLMADASNETAVNSLRERKRREAKPFALLMKGIEEVEHHCLVSPVEKDLLQSSRAPIVLLTKRSDYKPGSSGIAKNVAPGAGLLGVMLAHTPLHHLLLDQVERPLIATSANLSDDPICFEEADTFSRMGEIADLFLIHNRRITRALDDSVVRVIGGRGVVLRQGRGYVPGTQTLPLSATGTSGAPDILAYGGHLKSAIALSKSDSPQAYLGPHVGTLGSNRANERYFRELSDLVRDCSATPSIAACDLHPDYISTAAAEASGNPVLPVQHHHAHVLSCLADNEVSPPVLGVVWDGSGLGPDRTLWGGEFLTLTSDYAYRRMAHLRSFKLPGGELALREPRRAALGLLHEMLGERFFSELPTALQAVFDDVELSNFRIMLTRDLNSPVCSSAGRLFDAVASLMAQRQECDFEGQAAMELEALAWMADGKMPANSYSMPITHGKNGLELDWEPMIRAILADVEFGRPNEEISARFHWSLAAGIVDMAKISGLKKVALTGGVFQNKFLTEAAIGKLDEAGFQPLWHKTIPPNDGGLAIGQLMAARFKGG